MTADTAIVLHAATTLAMTGLIWFVQIVHYPLFRFAAAGDFLGFAEAHQRRTSWVVTPLMLAELAAAVWLVLPASAATPRLAWTGLVLLVSIWLTTAFVQVPLHRRLSRGFDPGFARRLVATNWLRTIAWTARAIVAVRLLRPASEGAIQ